MRVARSPLFASVAAAAGRYCGTHFSRRVLESMPERLLVQPVPAECGWTDLGTPARLRTHLHQARLSHHR